MRKLLVLITILLAGISALAEGTRTWQQTSFEDFEKGTSNGVAIRSDGSLELAPSFKPVATTPSTYTWALAVDPQGNVYVAAGAPARVYRITPTGETSVIFEPKELQVQSLVVDSRGVIYAATSPDGKVYKIERRAPPPNAGKKGAAVEVPATAPANGNGDLKPRPATDPDWGSSVCYEPKTKYIWALALDNAGNLYIATGDHGEIFRVDRTGQGALFFKSDEAHIRSLALDPQQNLIAGSDGSGLVYRISPDGQAFVLYSAPKKEITALALDRAGNIYASGVGDKRGGNASVAAPVMPPESRPQSGGSQGASAPLTTTVPAAGVAGGSEIYRIAPDGSPTRLWGSRDDVVYALALDGNNHLLAGTGNKGKVFSIANDDFTDLLKASATQVTAFAKAPGGGLYVSTSNLGKLFLLGAAPDADGSFQSDVFDARIFSRWGRAGVRGSGAFELWARSGNVDNPDRNWSPWRQVDLTRQTPLTVPPARFIQWKAVLHPGPRPAVVSDVTVNYLPKNVAPKVDSVAIQVGRKFSVAPRTTEDDTESGPNVAPRADQAVPASARDRNSIAVRWNAHDDNDDELIYAVYYRGDGETKWKLLKDRLIDRFYSFDAGLLPDGGYTVKVVASDAPSHSPDQSLTNDKESSRFEVDTTPPQVQDLNAAVEGDQLHITFRALDGFSDVRRAEYSVDAGEWQYVEPVGSLSDFRVENYDFAIPVPGTAAALQANGSTQDSASAQGSNVMVRRARSKPAGVDPPIEPVQPGSGEHLIVVRVYDKFDNVGVAKVLIHGK